MTAFIAGFLTAIAMIVFGVLTAIFLFPKESEDWASCYQQKDQEK